MASEQSNISGLGFFPPSLGFLQFKKINIYGLQKELRMKRMTSRVLSSSNTHLQEWNAYLLAKLSFSPSRSGSLSFCQSKWTSFHLWWVLDWSLLSWPVMTLCFHCSSSQHALGPLWKCSCPFWSQVYRVGRKRGDALRLQNRGGAVKFEGLFEVVLALTFSWAVLTQLLQRPLFLQLFMLEG